MIFSYYPGCTLKTKAKDLDRWARLSAEKLGVTMEEIDQWQCCGAVYPQADDEIATRLSAIRALNAAKEKNQDLLTLCSACHHVIKRVNHDMQTNQTICQHANNYLQLDAPYTGETKVVHYLEMLRDCVGFDQIKKAVEKPLKGRKVAAYYGCLLLRPSNVMAFDDPENPSILEEFLKSVGATPVLYSLRNECCGGYMALEDKQAAQSRVERILSSAKAQGAEEIVTACPLCMYNLDTKATQTHLPVRYFTELLAEALGVLQ